MNLNDNPNVFPALYNRDQLIPERPIINQNDGDINNNINNENDRNNEAALFPMANARGRPAMRPVNTGRGRGGRATIQRLSAARYQEQRRIIDEYIANERASGRELGWGDMMITALAQRRGRLVDPGPIQDIPDDAFFRQVQNLDRERQAMVQRNDEERLRLALEMHPIGIAINGVQVPNLNITVNVEDVRRILNLPPMNLNGLEEFVPPPLADPNDIPAQANIDHPRLDNDGNVMLDRNGNQMNE